MITEFFVLCSGADRSILKLCPLERTKFVGIGVTTFLTAVLASVSGSYFLTFVFADKDSGELTLAVSYIVIFGILWGFVIFNLDRNIIVSIKKTGHWKDEWMQGWVRIVLAIFIGFVIATPLELKLFEPEVNAKMKEQKKVQLKENREANLKIYESELSRLDKEIKQLEEEEKQKGKRRQELYESFKAEAEGTGGTYKMGKGPVFKEKKFEFDQADTLYKGILSQLTTKKGERNALMAKVQGIGLADEQVLVQTNGPETRIKALYDLSSLHWFITLLFILLETLPVVTKLLSKRGPYDMIVERMEYEYKLDQERIIEEKKDEVSNLLDEIRELNKLKGEVRLKVEKAKLDAELQANEVLLLDIAQKQAVLAQLAIDQWYEAEKQRLSQASNQSTSSTSSSVQFIDVLWKASTPSGDIFYLFKNGKQKGNEIHYEANGIKQVGQWDYITPDKEISVSLSNFSETYEIEGLTTNFVRLKSNTGVDIDLERV